MTDVIEEIERILLEEREQADALYQSLAAGQEPVSSAFDQALRLFSGDVQAALGWFRAPARALSGRSPAECAITEDGAEQVETLISQIEHGVVI